MNAGGNCIHGRTTSPIFIVPLLGLRRLTGFLNEVLHHRLEIAGPPVDRELAVGAGSLREHRMNVVDRLAAAKLVEHVVEELEQLDGESAHRDFRALAEVDQLAVEAPTSPPATCSPRSARR